MPGPILKSSTDKFTDTIEHAHSACGVGMIVNLPSTAGGISSPAEHSHHMVLDGLSVLKDFDYRSGFNPATEESDGSGIRFYGLSRAFFNKKIRMGEFISSTGSVLHDVTLKENRFIMGQYFLSTDPHQLNDTQTLISDLAKEHGLFVLGWRALNTRGVNLEVLSAKALEKKPSIWQAVLLQAPGASAECIAPDLFDLEHAAQKMSVSLSNQARDRRVPVHIVSQSSESIIYKGMLRSGQIAEFYLDLVDEDFTAYAITLHSRFATNTNPKWENAQLCPYFIGHNGELNSAPRNAMDMRLQMAEKEFIGLNPDKSFSDSIQLDADLLNQVLMRKIPLAEALVRLMPPPSSPEDSIEVKTMLQCFRKERIPYNGPAFIVASSAGFFMAKLDECGLRPSRWGIIERADGMRQLHAASDDYFESLQGVRVLKRGELKPGGMLMVTPEGVIMENHDILEQISQRYQQVQIGYFQTMYAGTHLPLIMKASRDDFHPTFHKALHRILFVAGWDAESVSQTLCPIAEFGAERNAAMGDDTNPLYVSGLPVHMSYFFHQLFAQVSAPAIDSIKERQRFTLDTSLGPTLGSSVTAQQQIILQSPILAVDELFHIELHPMVKSRVLSTNSDFPLPLDAVSTEEASGIFRKAIKRLLAETDSAVADGVSVLILSDRNISPERLLIPDLIAAAAVRKHLEHINKSRLVSIVADSYQVSGPHQATMLLAVGANAVYARGAYEKIIELYGADWEHKSRNFRSALDKCLLKTMGKMGLLDVNNYINGKFIAALGLNLSSTEDTLEDRPSLANIFAGLYSPLKGFTLGHVFIASLGRHYLALDPEHDFTVLPRSGFYMPENKGIKHGFGPEVVNAFTDWMKEEDIRAKLWQLHTILARKGFPDFLTDLSDFTPEQGFLDPREKSRGKPVGTYSIEYLEQFKPSKAFLSMSDKVDSYKRENPTSLRDYLALKHSLPYEPVAVATQAQAEIRSLLYCGSMSQGALTVSSPDTPEKRGAHETLTAGINAVHAMSASGEGGEAPKDLRDPLLSTRSKQIASGRFGVSAIQIICAKEIEIKVAQGAKPGEGGEVPGFKISVRFAAQRGGLPHSPFISPPPHHDIYSIEDLEELIRDVKIVNPSVIVSVKLVASAGIGTIAVGVAKAGSDVINIASNSGGTGSAQQSSIKHAGLPGEIGLAEVDKALRITGLRDLVLLRISGGIKTANDIIISAILGADQFELGTTSMLTLGCKMQRTCNQSCQPGVATDGHLFKGYQLNTERYYVNLAADVQRQLYQMGVSSLHALRGHTELLELHSPALCALYDFSILLDRSSLPEPLSTEAVLAAKIRRQLKFKSDKEDALVSAIQSFFLVNPRGVFETEEVTLTTQDRSFGARIAGAFVRHLEEYPSAKIIIRTTGTAGQSFCFVMPKGMEMHHQGTVQDGCAKSMTGGELILRTKHLRADYRSDENTLVGNAMLYGASGGRIFLNGVAGHRFGLLMKGSQVVTEGVGDFAFEYMTSGTALILGHFGDGLCTGASGGIVFSYSRKEPDHRSDAVRLASSEERLCYDRAIRHMLTEHAHKTESIKARRILEHFDIAHFHVWIPMEMDKINTLEAVLNVLKTYRLRQAPLTVGMQVWLEQKTLGILNAIDRSSNECVEFYKELHVPGEPLYSSKIRAQLIQILKPSGVADDFSIDLSGVSGGFASTTSLSSLEIAASQMVDIHPKIKHDVVTRLATLSGGLDETFLNALTHINLYVNQLSKDATGCSGCRAQSCAGGEKVDTGCPSGKPVNTINHTLKRIGMIPETGILTRKQWGALREAFDLQIQASPFIAYTGAACPAPCQDACTETIPDAGSSHPQRAGKPVGQHVHIKDIEYYLFQLGRSLGWFDDFKQWSHTEIACVFGDEATKERNYDPVMLERKVPFRRVDAAKRVDKELIIVGSGPAAMQIAYEALRDGVAVRMYEKSNKPGGLLADGIPAHKFDKIYIEEDFRRLVHMGLELHLNSEVFFDASSGEYRANGGVIASSADMRQYIALCVGAGIPQALKPAVTASLETPAREKIIQAIDFLKAANDVADLLKKHHEITDAERECLIAARFGQMDPRRKKIVVIGGGDTAQDVIRWVARYFNSYEDTAGELDVLIRGPELTERGVKDAYPAPSLAPTKEYTLQAEEVHYIGGRISHLVEPKAITLDAEEKLQVRLEESSFKYFEAIYADSASKLLFDKLPRDKKPIDPAQTRSRLIEGVDMIICALGFRKDSEPMLAAIKAAAVLRVYFSGDASNASQHIIVDAIANAKDTYEGQIRPAMEIQKRSSNVLSHYGLYKRSVALRASDKGTLAIDQEPSHSMCV